MLKIHTHTHIFPEKWPDLKERYGYGGFIQLEHHGPGCAHMMQDGKLFRETGADCRDPDVRIADCDRTDVDGQVLSTVPVMFGYWAKPADTADLARLLNDHIAGLVAEYPFPLGEHHPGKMIEEMSLDDKMIGNLLANSALEWLALSPKDSQ